MRVECKECGALVTVPGTNTTVLSRRNLIHLLARLESGELRPRLFKQDGTEIVAEPDDIHYQNYRPGTLSDPDTANEIELFLQLRKVR